MNIINSVLVLNSEIHFLSVNKLSAFLVKKIGGDLDDYIMSIKNSRIPSIRISKEFKLFIESFSEPKTLTKAVFDFSLTQNVEPSNLLNSVYPEVKRFISTGFISNIESNENEHSKKVTFNNAVFHGYKIISSIQVLDDSETYKAESESGQVVFLKIVKKCNQNLIDNFENELEILKILNSDIQKFVPQIIEYKSEKEYSFLVLEWIDGTSLWEFINDNSNDFDSKKTILNQLLNSYEYIHSMGILHGDIHPNNILVSSNKTIVIIDFGTSFNINKNLQCSEIRAGVINYYEPELAKSILQSNLKIVSTWQSEQYQIAILIYQVITNSSYLLFNYETENILKEIINSEPIKFVEHQIVGNEIEKTINRALSKKPNLRYRSMNLFYKAIRNSLKFPITRLEGKTANPSSNIFEKKVTEFINDYGFDSDKLLSYNINSPKGSYFHGSTGIAYTFYRLSIITKRPELLSIADVWIKMALKNKSKSDAFFSAQLEMTKSNIGPYSIFHGIFGMFAIDILITHTLSNNVGFLEKTDRLLTLIEKKLSLNGNKFLNDPTQGPASVLLILSLLSKLNYEEVAHLKSRIEYLEDKILSLIVPKIFTTLNSTPNYLGFAHGITGLLYMVIQTDSFGRNKYGNQLKDCLELLLDNAIESENSISWPVAISENNLSEWTGWCHGSAGHLLLWLVSYNVFKEEKYLNIALKIGENMWNKSYSEIPTICCGNAGQSLSFYLLGKCTNNPKWINKGLEIAEKAVKSNFNFILPDSLFQGKVGLALLSGESLEPDNCKWPLFHF